MIDLINGDCLEAMKGIADNSIDLTVTSPPYDNLRSYNGNNELWNEQVWKDVIAELYRVTKQGGVVVWVVGDATIKGSETGTSFKQALWGMECGFNLHDTMIYHKANTQPLNHARYEQSFEYMFIFSKGKPVTVNLQHEPCKKAGDKLTGNMRHSGKGALGIKHGVNKPIKATKPRGNIWTYNVGWQHSYNKPYLKGHPAIYPEKLAKDHILSWSNEGDTVLDCFMGSGTTGAMAIETGRKFIGIELDYNYFNIAEKRINEHKNP